MYVKLGSGPAVAIQKDHPEERLPAVPTVQYIAYRYW